MAVGEQPDLSGATPPLVGGFVATEFGGQAYAFFGGYHWLVEPLFCGGDMTTYPGPGTLTAVAINVHRIDSAGVDTVFPVELPIYFQWESGFDGYIVDLCTVTYTMKRTHWNAGVGNGSPQANFIDVALATDGTTLWLGVICLAEDPYPYYQSHYHIPFKTPEALEAYSAAGFYWAYQGSIFCSGSGSPWDDLGHTLTQRWENYRLLMFSSSGGGFTNIGQIAPAYNNADPSVGDGPCAISGVEICASPAQPGVCHAVWSESGLYGQRDARPEPFRGSRLNYSAWGPGGMISESDVFRYDGIQDIGPYPPPNRPAGVGWLNPSRLVGGIIKPWALPMTEATYAYTPIFALRNDHGSPVMFYSPLKLLADGSDPDNADWQLKMIDPSTGAVLQELTADLLPQPSETQYDWESGGVGYTVTRIPSVVSGTTIEATRLGSLAVSRLYSDPLLGGQAVYLVNVVFTTGSISGAQGIYRVPCDGSSPFTVLDGDRNLAIFPNANHPSNPGDRRPFIPTFDFFSEAKSAWVPSGQELSGFIIPGLLQLDRECAKDWVETQLSTDSNAGAAERSGAYYDPVAKKFYYASYFSDVGQTKIVPNICGPAGIHIWDLPPGHR